MLYALDKEVAAKRERRVNKLLKASRSPNPDACIEDITYTPGRTINKEQITRLAHCQWCQSAQNIVILGKSSVGKTYLAQALLTAACRNDYSARFFRTDTLANCGFGVVGTASPRSWYRCSTYPVLQGVFFHS